MTLDALESMAHHPLNEEEQLCQPHAANDLHVRKGGFPGTCHHCGQLGHKIPECRKRDEEATKKRKPTTGKNYWELGSGGKVAGGWDWNSDVRSSAAQLSLYEAPRCAVETCHYLHV